MSILVANPNPIHPALERVAIAAWSGELPFSQRALADALAPELGEDPAHVAQRLPHYLDVLACQGIYTSQRARYGADRSPPQKVWQQRQRLRNPAW